jgi:hypothetical protein
MVTIATPYRSGCSSRSNKLPLELDEAARIDSATPLQLFRLVYLPLMLPSLVAVGIRSAARLEPVPARSCFLRQEHDLGVASQFLGRRFAVGAADDDKPILAAGGNRPSSSATGRPPPAR